MKNLIESSEAIDAILTVVAEGGDSSHNWVTVDDIGMVKYKPMSSSQGIQDAFNLYDQRKLQGLTHRNRFGITRIQVLSLKRNYHQFRKRNGVTLVVLPCATDLCLEFTSQGLKKNHCFSGTRSLVLAVGENTEFKLVSGRSWNDFATIIYY